MFNCDVIYACEHHVLLKLQHGLVYTAKENHNRIYDIRYFYAEYFWSSDFDYLKIFKDMKYFRYF